jgi:hypothetical protein
MIEDKNNEECKRSMGFCSVGKFKKVIQLPKNNVWIYMLCICFEELFVILLAYVDLIKSSKLSDHPESKAVFMCENII